MSQGASLEGASFGQDPTHCTDFPNKAGAWPDTRALGRGRPVPRAPSPTAAKAFHWSEGQAKSGSKAVSKARQRPDRFGSQRESWGEFRCFKASAAPSLAVCNTKALRAAATHKRIQCKISLQLRGLIVGLWRCPHSKSDLMETRILGTLCMSFNDRAADATHVLKLKRQRFKSQLG